MCNQEIRIKAKKAKIPIWRIADELEISDMTLFRRLRHELPQAQKEEILGIIERLEKEKESA